MRTTAMCGHACRKVPRKLGAQRAEDGVIAAKQHQISVVKMRFRNVKCQNVAMRQNFSIREMIFHIAIVKFQVFDLFIK